MLSESILKMKSITKDFPGVCALDNVDLELYEGEVLAVVGENGAGKSTLMKVLNGVIIKDKGEIILFGQTVDISDPLTAQKLKISVIYQELNLFPDMNVAENIFIQHLPYNEMGLVNFKELKRKTEEIIELLGVPVASDAKVSSLSIAEQQTVEILKAISLNSKIIVMDEPTSSLSDKEVTQLFKLIRNLKKEGISIIYISHRLEEIFEIADRVMVLRDGKKISEMKISDANLPKIIRDMVGRDIKTIFPERGNSFGDVILEAKGLTKKGEFYDINFSIRSGEIVGIAGLIGAGRTELANAIFGADTFDSGELYLDGKKVEITDPYDAINLGMGMVPEDRKGKGLILSMAVRPNISITIMKKLSRGGLIKFQAEYKIAENMIKQFSIHTPSVDTPTISLSGGNQQKVILAKWLQINPKMLILDEPTRGIDIGAKAEIFELIRKLANQGVGIIMINSELPEILGLSDKILVMSNGRITGEFKGGECSAEDIMTCATKLVEKVINQ